MKTGRKRGVCLFLVACVLWGMVGVLPVAAAGEATSLEGARIEIAEGNYKYRGSAVAIQPRVLVWVNKKPISSSHYTVSYENNLNAGTGKILVTGKGNYTGTVDTTFEIRSQELPVENFELLSEKCIKEYDGTCDGKAKVRVSTTYDGTVETMVDAEYEDPHVGKNKEIIVRGSDLRFGGPEGKNYIVNDPSVVLKKNIGEIKETEETSPISLPIEKFELAPGGCIKDYDGTCDGEAKVIVTTPFDGVVKIRAKATYQDRYAGGNKQIRVQGSDLCFEVPGGKSYVVDNPSATLVGNVGAIKAKEPPSNIQAEVAFGLTRNLKEYVPKPWRETATFQVEPTDIENLKGSSLSGDMLTAGDQRTSFTVYAFVKEFNIDNHGEKEYYSGTINIKVNVVKKESQNPIDPGDTDDKGEDGDTPPSQPTESQGKFSIGGPRTMTYGETLRLTPTGGAGDGAVSFEVRSLDKRGQATIDQQGFLTATQVGEVLVSAKKDGDDRYNPVEADPIKVTIQPATVIIQVKNKTAKVGDPAPALGHTDYTIKGLVAGDQMVSLPTLYYAPDPDMTQEGRTSILASGAVVPAGGNYHSQVTCFSGTLVIEKGKDPDEEKQPEPGSAHAITIRQTENGAVKADCRKARAGEEVILTTTPAKGYVLEKLTVRSQGKTLALWQEEEGRHTFTMPDQEVTVSASFAEKPKEPEKPEQPQEPELPKELPFLDVGGVDWVL